LIDKKQPEAETQKARAGDEALMKTGYPPCDYYKGRGDCGGDKSHPEDGT
jgi:hypothetical protein